MAQLNSEVKVILTLGLSLLLIIMGCHGARVMVGKYPSHDAGPTVKEGPPAHGCRTKHRYLYYPSAYVYFDVGRRLYFYYSVGQWRVSATLPSEIRIDDLDDNVTLEMDTDKPYEFHQDVVKRYPPGHLKHKNKRKGKGKSKEVGA